MVLGSQVKIDDERKVVQRNMVLLRNIYVVLKVVILLSCVEACRANGKEGRKLSSLTVGESCCRLTVVSVL